MAFADGLKKYFLQSSRFFHLSFQVFQLFYDVWKSEKSRPNQNRNYSEIVATGVNADNEVIHVIDTYNK